MHNATAITTGSVNQRPNTLCIRLWIDVTFRGLEDSYSLFSWNIVACDVKQTLKIKSNIVFARKGTIGNKRLCEAV